MKVLLILVAWVASTYAGVGVTTPEVEEEALRLWNKFCDGASDGGNDAGIFVYCKRARGAIRQSFEHNLELPKGREGQQIIFVQPPSYNYKHDVVVSGGQVSARKTVIYVKPGHKNTHEINIKDETQKVEEAQKPRLFFLKGGHGTEQEQVTEKSPEAPPATYLPPQNTYLPPK